MAAITFATMQTSDIDEVIRIEQNIYRYPWTRSNFLDALANHYQTALLHDQNHRLLGYYVMMWVIDEAHLLNMSIDINLQRQGLGSLLLRHAMSVARQHQMRILLLEVRVSNTHAFHFYQRHGFIEIGRRKNYYRVRHDMREDAILMQMSIQ